MKLIDYCVKLSDEETFSSVAESIVGEQAASEGLAMIMVLIKMASTGCFLRGLAEPARFETMDRFILDIDTDILTIETFVFMGLCVNRSGSIEGIASSNVHFLDHFLNEDVARITLEVIDQFADFDAQPMMRNRRRMFVETRKAKKEVSGSLVRILYASPQRSRLSDPLDMTRFKDADLVALADLQTWLNTCSSNMLRAYRHAFEKYADQL